MRISDWSSDVCSSDLKRIEHGNRNAILHAVGGIEILQFAGDGGIYACRNTIEPDEWGVTDQLCSVIGDAHDDGSLSANIFYELRNFPRDRRLSVNALLYVSSE